MTVTNEEMAFLEELLLQQLVISIENLYKNTASIQMSEDEAAIITAAKIGPIEVCEKLLELPNLKVNMTSSIGISALMLAALKGHKGLVDNLINCPEIDINGTDMTLNQNPALWYAVAAGHKEIIGMFLEHPAIDINKASKSGTTALTTAVRGGDIEIVRILLKCRKVEINKMKNDFEDVESALWLAADAGHKEIVSMLLNRSEVDVNGTLSDTPLSAAAFNGHKEIVGMLLEHPTIDVKKVGRCRVEHRALNKTALDNAVTRDQSLLRSGLSNEVVQDQKEIVRMLLQYSETSAIQIFIQHSYKKNAERNSLIKQAKIGLTDAVRNIINLPDTDINMTNEEGRTALMFAAYRGHEETVTLLLEQSNIDVTKEDRYGFSAIVLAACGGRKGTFGKLLAHINTIFGKTKFGEANITKKALEIIVDLWKKNYSPTWQIVAKALKDLSIQQIELLLELFNKHNPSCVPVRKEITFQTKDHDQKLDLEGLSMFLKPKEYTQFSMAASTITFNARNLD